MAPTLLITRPVTGAERFMQFFQDRDDLAEVVISPLLEIVHETTLPPMEGIRALIFTSQNGVEAYQLLGGPRHLSCYCVGTQTAAMAQDYGLTVVMVGVDAAELIGKMHQTEVISPILQLRGEYARMDIAAHLGKAGYDARAAVVYRQIAHPLSSEAKRVLKGGKIVLVPLFSPRTAAQFTEENRGTAPIWVVAMSAAVAQECSKAAPERLIVAPVPDMESMRVCVESLIKDATRLERREGEE